MTAPATPDEQRQRELAILNAIARALNRSVDLPQALHATLGQVAERFGLETGWVWLLDEHSGDSYLAAAQNLPPALADDPRRMAGRCYCLDTFRNDNLKGAANVNVLTCSRLYNVAEGTRGLRYHASIPLRLQGRKLGVLNLASADWRELSEDDLRLLHTVGDLLSIAVERARLFERSSQTGAAEERYRLARELHDTLGQGLTAALLRLESVDALLEADADRDRVRQQVAQAMDLIRANIEEARRSVLDLRAAPLEGQNLVQAIQRLADECAQANQLQITFEHIDGQRPLATRLEAGLYRMVQEALNNIVRHANAVSARLSLVATPDAARLTIEDDGRGFTPAQIPDGRYGLVGLNERARLLGGSLQIESSPGAGTRLEFALPLIPIDTPEDPTHERAH